MLLLEYVCVDEIIDEVLFCFLLDLEMFDFRFLFFVLFWLFVLVIIEVSEVLKLSGIEFGCLIFVGEYCVEEGWKVVEIVCLDSN